MIPSYVYRGVATRIVDGDTLVVAVDLGFRASIEITVRLRGCNAPEHNKPGGAAAAGYLSGLVGLAVAADKPRPLLIESYKDHMSFARWVCDVWLEGDQDKTLADHLIGAGHAKPFDPSKDHWTPNG